MNRLKHRLPALAAGILAIALLTPVSLHAQVYFQLDALVWWTKGNHLPVLLSTSPNGTARNDAGVLGRGATPLVGGRAAEDMERYGGRARLGYWLDADQNSALEFHYFGIDNANGYGTYAGSSSGDPILARPFFNAASSMEDAQLVAFPGVVTGSVLIDASSEMHSSGILYRTNVRRGPRGRLDFFGGYRYLRFREALHVQENLVNLDATLIQVNTTIDVLDRFVTENDFNGLEFGFDLEVDTGFVIVDILAKLGLGNVHQEVSVHGQTVVTTPGDPSVVSQGGLLALPTNIGTRDNDEFALLPEININLRYPLTETVDIQLGYTLMYLTSVVRTGDQIDRNVNPTQLPMAVPPFSGPASPRQIFNDTSIWAQGINLGLFGTF